ncbi:HAMP domain-containing histidine kinase [Paenibacillus thiaminolyticus]|uniref:sensor histidine kinase n=1 Tax=Paenibacillus thiaminolyticus TaxID=49283 RepID=UPI002350B9DC|nr:HAMP domain-containing sensor histidine kinase [Paenibacillus thiaminolyticus]WCR28173.1 HAMP domain-containing histidine kinase [Paenibacillus thiaminolyticus]
MKAAERIRRFIHPGSLRFQLLSRSLLILAALLMLIGVFQYLVMQQFVYENKAESLKSQISSFPREAWQLLTDRDDGVPGRRPMLFLPADASLAIIDANGAIQAVSMGDKMADPPELSPVEYQAAMNKSRKEVNYRVMNDSEGEEQLVVLQPLEWKGRMIGLIQVNTSTKPLKEMLASQLLTFLSLSLLALIGGMIAFLPVLRRTLIPLSNMVHTVERIDAGNLAERVPSRQGQLEIDRLALSFNGMLERLESSFEAEKEAKEQMRRFVADASHELRTPLTSIHGFLEVLLRGAMNQPEQLRKALISMYGESERINKLVQDLLLLAKLDRAPVMELADGDLNRVLRELEPQLRLLGGQRHVTLALAEEANCKYDPDKMKQVVLNLFHNAVQHTEPEKGDIRIVTETVPGGVELTVRDNGTGIGKRHLPHLFDRFYRSESSRTRKYGGAGLGLSITKSIVEAHGGAIRVSSAEGQGSSFIVTLPAAVPPWRDIDNAKGSVRCL